MTEPEPLPPESVLLRRARAAQGPSPEKMVLRMGVVKISARYWRQIEDGQKRAPDDTLAHMARVIGLSPERLDEVDRHEAAEILREIIKQTVRIAPAIEEPTYPDFVGDDELFRYIWDGPGLEVERQAAITGIQVHRQMYPTNPGQSERDGRHHA